MIDKLVGKVKLLKLQYGCPHPMIIGGGDSFGGWKMIKDLTTGRIPRFFPRFPNQTLM